jgi:large subunit ribosomal protein L35
VFAGGSVSRYSTRLDTKGRTMPKHKQKSHKGLLKRVKVTAGGKVRHQRAGKSHLMSAMSSKRRRQLRKVACVKKGDIGRVEKMLHRELKGV